MIEKYFQLCSPVLITVSWPALHRTLRLASLRLGIWWSSFHSGQSMGLSNPKGWGALNFGSFLFLLLMLVQNEFICDTVMCQWQRILESVTFFQHGTWTFIRISNSMLTLKLLCFSLLYCRALPIISPSLSAAWWIATDLKKQYT